MQIIRLKHAEKLYIKNNKRYIKDYDKKYNYILIIILI